jgi:hypothetical protein
MRGWTTFLTAATLLVASCLGADDARLDVGAEQHPRYALLRERLSITIEPPADGAVGLSTECSADINATSPCCNTSYCSARGLADFIAAGCAAAPDPSLALPTRSTSSASSSGMSGVGAWFEGGGMSGVGAWFEGGAGRGGVEGSFVPGRERLSA